MLFAEVDNDYQRLHGMSTQAGLSAAKQNFLPDGKSAAKIFAPYSIYKGKAALSASPILPRFSKLELALPHIMGWDQYTNQHPKSLDEKLPKFASKFLAIEWDR